MIAVTTDYDRFRRVDRNRVNVDDVGEHRSVFKYVSLDNPTSWERARDTIVDRKLIGTSPKRLNDPFEGNPHIIPDDTEERLRDARRYISKNEMRVDLNSIEPDFDVDEVRRSLDRKLAATIDNARILSFCMRAESHLLWSHYANMHKGACFHFAAGAFTGQGVRRGTVTYSAQRPTVHKSLIAKISLPRKSDLHPDLRVQYREELYRYLFFSKPLDWAYEQEFRLVYSTKNEDHLLYEPSGLLEVILGVNASQKTQQRIEGYIRRSGRNIVLKRASISPATFAVDVISPAHL